MDNAVIFLTITCLSFLAMGYAIGTGDKWGGGGKG